MKGRMKNKTMIVVGHWRLSSVLITMGGTLFCSLNIHSSIYRTTLESRVAAFVDFPGDNIVDIITVSLMNDLSQHGRLYFPLSYKPDHIELPFCNASKQREHEEAWLTSYPDINIVGYPKAGTSHLYRILLGHSRTEGANEKKEFCVHDFVKNSETIDCDDSSSSENGNQSTLHAYRTVLHRKRAALNGTQLTVNGCLLGSEEVRLNYRYIPARGEKFIIMLRDPADWVWAMFNYWAIENMDAQYAFGMLTIPMIHYRSSTLFHEIISSNGAMSVFHGLFEPIRKATYDSIEMINLVGRQNLLFLKSEDLLPSRIHSLGTLSRLSTFLSIDIQQFGNESYEMTNCNNEKGTEIVCTHSDVVGSYDTSRGVILSENTRKMIFSFCQNACILWREKLDVDYPNCRLSS